MTHQPYKQFNTYKEGLDLELLREYCMEQGEVRTFTSIGGLRGEPVVPAFTFSELLYRKTLF